MATVSNYSVLRLMSTLGGLGLVGVAAFLNVNHAAESEGSIFSPVCIAIVALAFGSALAVPVMFALWRSGRRGLALVALAGLVCSESYGFQLSAERLLASRAQRAQQVQTVGSPYRLAREALDLSIEERKAECAGGFGDEVLQAAGHGRRETCRACSHPRSDVARPHRGRHWPAGMAGGDRAGDVLLDWLAGARLRARRLRRARLERGDGTAPGGTSGAAR